MTDHRAKDITLKTTGFYRRFHGKNVLDSSFFLTSDGRWYGRLQLNNWTVKETYRNTLEDIRDWCFDSFMELHLVGYQEEEVNTLVVHY
jgi:hypothetical protein